ncbi:MAG: cytochrome c biogenesis protein CcdA [Bacillota bacterium]|nr:cytochrome c biogenesis protein CcdA [Bacillota bacterium]
MTSWLLALTGGFLSFVSPCTWPLYPAYLFFLTGTRSPVEKRGRTFGTAFLFVLGFTVVFAALGATAASLGQILLQYQTPLRQVGGLLVIAFGLYLLGLIPASLFPSTPSLGPTRPPASPWAAFPIGMAFSFAWTPCITPILGSILFLAGSTAHIAQGMLLLALYSLGLGIPFLLLALFFETLQPLWKKVTPSLGLIQKVSGAFLVILGIMIFTDSLSRLSSWLQWVF